MDSKNVIAAISLSAAVIILYSLFFAPTQEELKQKKIPFIIRRPLPNGKSEYWDINDLEILE